LLTRPDGQGPAPSPSAPPRAPSTRLTLLAGLATYPIPHPTLPGGGVQGEERRTAPPARSDLMAKGQRHRRPRRRAPHQLGSPSSPASPHTRFPTSRSPVGGSRGRSGGPLPRPEVT